MSARHPHSQDGGQEKTEESEKENSRRHNTRSRPDKRKLDNVNKNPKSRYLAKCSPELECDSDGTWKQSQKDWFKRMKKQHESNQLKKSDPKAWKKAEKNELLEKMKALER